MADNNVRIVAEVEVKSGDAGQKVGDLKKNLAGVGNEAKKSSKEVADGMGKIGDSLGTISPAAKRATDGIKGFNSILNVLKANPIIATIAALTGVVIALFQPFKKMEAVSDSLGKAFGTLSGVFNTFITGILTPLIGGFVKLVELTTGGVIFVLDALGVTSKETADSLGNITEALDNLEDAEKNSALATAESNRKLQEAREIAADANVPIRERIDALKEAGRIEKEELDKVVQINRTKAALMLEQIGIELGARDGLIAKIKEGSLESLKAARAELASMKNVDKEKLYSIDQLIIAAENSGAQSAKISKKVQSQITGIEKEEQAKRKAASDAAIAKKKADQEIIDKAEADRLKKLADANKVIEDAYISTLDARDAEIYKAGKAHNERMKALAAAGITDTLAIEEQYRAEKESINKKYDDQDQKAKDEKKAKEDAEKLKTQTEEKAAADKKREDDLLGVQNKLAEDALTFEQQRELELERQKIRLSDTALTENQRQQIVKETSDAIIQINKKEVDLRAAQIEKIGQIIQNLGSIVGKQTAVGKGLAIAEATINTFVAGTAALKAIKTAKTPLDAILGITTMAAVIASGLKTVKEITKVQIPGGGGGGSVPSTPSFSTSAPLTSQAQTTVLNQGQINQIGNVAARAYVVESDVTSAQERANRLNRAATIQ